MAAILEVGRARCQSTLMANALIIISGHQILVDWSNKVCKNPRRRQELC